MRLRRPHALTALLSASAVLMLVAAIVDMGRTSPGPLSSVHAHVAELQGGEGCAQCHGGWFGGMTASCLDCHAAIDEQLDERSGLHGAITEGAAEFCAACHSEHNGLDFPLVNDLSFARAGVPDVEAFDHGLIGFVMEGGHVELACNECHANADVKVLPEGEPRFLGLEQGCATCHEDPHEGRMVLDCASCHGQVTFDEFHARDHDEQLPLVGAHAELSCAECHDADSQRSLLVLGESWNRLAPRACEDCHDSPHAAGFVERVAAREGLATRNRCGACHAAEHTAFGDVEVTVSAAQHALTGFSLDIPHDEVSCAACHATELATFEERHPGRDAERCATCHADPHGGQFEGRADAAEGCLACHDRQRFAPHAFTSELHALAGFELTGQHTEADCAACHPQAKADTPRVFQGTPGTCELCHEDAHLGFFDDVAFTRPPVAAGTCAECHLTTAFSELPATGFDHDAWAGFLVGGAHAQESCELCHERSVEPDRFGRTFGHVEERFGPFEGCVTCHRDPHEGRFDGPEHAPVIAGRTDCARCHVQASFRAFPDGFDHEQWTGFSLVGAHGELSCTACHAPLAEPTEFGRTLGPARSSDCAACHDDPHAGQFEREGDTDCRRCHASADSFTALSFRHNRDSRFPLGEQHESVACAACHTADPEVAGAPVRYRPLDRSCVACHGLHDDAARGRRNGPR